MGPDTAYALTALFRFGLREETHAAISWLLAAIRRHGPAPLILYALDGSVHSEDPAEQDAPGWRGIGPVVIGNRATDQLQLGVFGDLFSIVQLYVDNGNVLDDDTGRTLAAIADLTCDAWRRPDSGMWELTEVRHYTTSKLGCWQALTNAAHLADLGRSPVTPPDGVPRPDTSASGSRLRRGLRSARPTCGTRVRWTSTAPSSCTPSAGSTAATG